MNDEHKQDAAEPTPASAGSVAGEPVAWGVLLAGGERIYDVYDFEEEAKAIDEAVTGNHGVVPLYRSPTLTDAERWAVSVAMGIINEGNYGWPDGTTPPQDTLRGLLQRHS